MSVSRRAGLRLISRYPGTEFANAAINALTDAGIPLRAIELTTPGHEGRYLWRILISIVLWSVLGGAIGAIAGLVLALAGIGPGGTTGAVVQVVSWTIAGHLLGGMWVGYALLADQTHGEMAPDRASEAVATLTVRCRNETELQTAQRVLDEVPVEPMEHSGKSS
jgi:hypothetical protein